MTRMEAEDVLYDAHDVYYAHVKQGLYELSKVLPYTYEELLITLAKQMIKSSEKTT